MRRIPRPLSNHTLTSPGYSSAFDMYPRPLILLLVGTCYLVDAAVPTSPLRVVLTGPPTVHSIDDIRITAAITNTGPDPVTVVNYGTVFDSERPTRSFTVTKDGAAVDFIGVKIRLDGTQGLSDAAYTTIPAGGTVRAEHSVAPLYDFASLGPGAFTFEPLEQLQVLHTDTPTGSVLPQMRRIQAGTSGYTVNVTEDVRRRRLAGLGRRAAGVQCADQSRIDSINRRWKAGQDLAGFAARFLSTNTSSDAYNDYFGSTLPGYVRRVFVNAADKSRPRSVVNCDDRLHQCNTDIISYFDTRTNQIFVCDAFFDAPEEIQCDGSAENVRQRTVSGTMLHELTYSSGTADYAYGCDAALVLTADDTGLVAQNADSYECFVAQAWRKATCH
ncbi:Deuterolysin metalloprotease family-domain-containing protein [Trametes elegans]|nr:Deuterolysin metalloprotease family-domain-containing protein [Trametes elegans]